ncbi:MAG: gamma-glutamyltransferase [Candidatus Marinamargulisbacteria bacterium]
MPPIIIGIILILNQVLLAIELPILSGTAIHHPVVARHGMVASQEHHATNVGLAILKKGGNAVDAAVAMGFALAVTHPQAGNLGGGGFMIIHMATPQQTIALDFRETAPATAHRNMFLNPSGNVDTTQSRFSSLASGVPGTVHGLLTALTTHGTMPRSTVLSPAIHLAKQGFLVSPTLAHSLKRAQPRLMKDPYISTIFYPHGQPYRAGDRLIQKDLSATLTHILHRGIQGFYDGPNAQKWHDFMKRHGGAITPSDLKNYTSVFRQPIQIMYRGHAIYSMPPPSSGGIIMGQLLQLMAPYPLRAWGHNSAKTMHVMTEAMQQVYADRAEWLGDTDHVDVPVNELLSPSYLAHRQKNISLTRHTPSQKTTHGTPNESDETTHYSVVDRWGNAVSVTTTLNFSYGSGRAIPGTGVLLNNQMDDFSAKPGVPNAYGLIGTTRNAIAPHKRMLSSMTPTIVLKDNQVFLVTGSPGGSRIITTVTQIISHVIDHNMTIAEATAAPRFHHQWWPDELRIEPGFSNDTLNILRNMGHTIVVKPVMGSTQSILKQNGWLYGASDPRTPSGQTRGY